jgi:GNAT superfamily N-acetyltransferase
MPDGLTVETLWGEGTRPVIEALARLRVEVFREFPYLYAGDAEYERGYLSKYAGISDGTIVIARDGAQIVGASTALPLAKAGADASRPFVAAGVDLGSVYYFGESVLRRTYRGRGLGVAFFERREARGRELGFKVAAFCAVERPADHPRRPKDYVPLDAFWAKRGYTRRPDLRTTFTWQDLDDADESSKPMVFWTKTL